MCNILLLNLRKFSSFKFMDQGRSGVKYARDFQTLNVKKSVHVDLHTNEEGTTNNAYRFQQKI